MLAEIITTVIATAIAGAGGLAWKQHRERRDKKKIYDLMLDSMVGTDWQFRSKEAISSHTNITTERVIILCTKLCADGKLVRNQKEADSWRLS